MTDSPARPPEAELLRRARRRLRLPLREASAAAGLSESRLRQIEAGYQTVSKGVQIPTSATDVTLAHLAKAYGITPEELEESGRADGAEVLREILRPQAPAAPALRPVSSPPPPSPGSPAEEYLAELLARYQDDDVVQAIGAQKGTAKAASVKVAEILEWLDFQSRISGQGPAGSGFAG